MSRKLFAFCSLFILLFSCRQKETAHIAPQQMQQILFDIHLAESYSTALHSDSTKRNTERNLDSLAVFYRSVFQHHNITQQQFEESLDWYKQNPEDLDSIYARLIPEMGKLEAKYD
ncbi:MAG TPA: DUF4296 domain-containing protein [Flavipsychrobacter sp.]|mgnify:CR=1 FL=1|nr:DUF4296 domain-containing protein [Flavipsychrobacter sp.]